ncbi:IQ calmodulin-binding motif-containing protein 1 [Anabrus simplex]|uniref:IQ calmodulin-binding motif-containing protein 1 n=1 Tax=Anabrus simplex TaxID=316456 RepID=UPI0035A27CD3
MDLVWAVPAAQRTFYVIELRNRAAVRIQLAWRRYKARRTSSIMYSSPEHKKAAVIIQRAVRRWLALKEESMLTQQHLLSEGINEERLAQLQQEIKDWQNAHDEYKAEGLKKLDENHKEVQKRLNSWYMRASTRQRRDQHIEAKCAQLGATVMLLKSSPPLADLNSVDMEFYKCPALPYATEARLKHKQQLRALSAPWWEQLELQGN